MLAVPPVVTFVFDLVVAALLLRCRPGWRGWPESTPAGRLVLRAVGVLTTMLIGAVGWSQVRYGSLSVAVAALRAEPVAVAPGSLRMGIIPAGGTAERTLRVVNLSDEPVQVSLAQSNCGCAEVGGLPVTIPPGQEARLPIAVTVGTRAGSFRRAGRLRTSAGDVNYAITAWVVGDTNGEQNRSTENGEGQR